MAKINTNIKECHNAIEKIISIKTAKKRYLNQTSKLLKRNKIDNGITEGYHRCQITIVPISTDLAGVILHSGV
jgi:hypothetical protein